MNQAEDLRQVAPEEMVGRIARFRKTVSESDIYGFAGITGDLDPVHVDEEESKRAGLPGRIAHGVLTLGYTSAASSIIMQDTGITAVSLGYDRVRFVTPVLIGDTVAVTYEIIRYVPEEQRLIADVKVVNQHGEVVAVATHIHKILESVLAVEPLQHHLDSADAPIGVKP